VGEGGPLNVGTESGFFPVVPLVGLADRMASREAEEVRSHEEGEGGTRGRRR